MKPIEIEISIDDQELRVLRDGGIERRYPAATSERGAGTRPGSFRTPTGRFQIGAMIGDDASPGTIFRGREQVGVWDGSKIDQDLVLSRIMWLEGLEEHNANTRKRFIYIHGTNHEDEIGRPSSQGCIRLTNPHVIELFALVEPGTPVTITPPTKGGGKLAFFDCDSTLSAIEGIDELARGRGDEAFRKVEELTNAAMNGEVPIDEVFPRRMDIIRPDRALCERVAARYVETITPGTREALDSLRDHGWTIIILSGGFAPLIAPLAAKLGVRHVDAVPLHLDLTGAYAGYDHEFPTTRNGGKPELIREWKEALLPRRVVMIGDGISDLESRTETDLFIGYGGVVERAPVKRGADHWIGHMSELVPILEARTPLA